MTFALLHAQRHAFAVDVPDLQCAHFADSQPRPIGHGQRMTLRVEQGKGHKDRYAMLSPVLLERLRVWWRVARAQGRMLDGGWLFPGLDPLDQLSTRQLNRAIHAAAEAAG